MSYAPAWPAKLERGAGAGGGGEGDVYVPCVAGAAAGVAVFARKFERAGEPIGTRSDAVRSSETAAEGVEVCDAPWRCMVFSAAGLDIGSSDRKGGNLTVSASEKLINDGFGLAIP